ncbi:chemotaxis protein [Helicobacter sp. 11S03491-1]|uniref:chemotaxis protein n=1 Tax=Helicobacter sp. 11S03491-1 TaxID=1476196 RepID=UPI000BA631F6|nr:chemotaxis protein [Helicobacter sp. 11S03491-1]PAF43733.1 chemotaxis protein [Helicobacter sp. 11S03491-1]
MTQEELDALIMSGDIDLDVDVASKEKSSKKDIQKPKEEKHSVDQNEELSAGYIDPKNYKVEAGKKWPPPPPTDEHKVVHQLDDVTKDSEVKASQIFDQLDHISNGADNIVKLSKEIQKYLQKNQDIFEKLTKKFPHVETFSNSLEETKQITTTLKSITQNAHNCSDASVQAMDIMQFQDIHRQKIERVINVMRALAQYMNSLFEGKIDDSKRVSSAVYIAGDDKKDMASEEDIEALIASFGKQ